MADAMKTGSKIILAMSPAEAREVVHALDAHSANLAEQHAHSPDARVTGPRIGASLRVYTALKETK